MNVLIAVSLMGVIISPNSHNAQSSTPASVMAQESYSGVSVNDIVPAWRNLADINPAFRGGISSSVSNRTDKWLREQRDDAAFYSPPRSCNAHRGATMALPPSPSAQANGGRKGRNGIGKPPCVPEVSTTLTLAAGGLGVFYTRRRLKISRN